MPKIVLSLNRKRILPCQVKIPNMKTSFPFNNQINLECESSVVDVSSLSSMVEISGGDEVLMSSQIENRFSKNVHNKLKGVEQDNDTSSLVERKEGFSDSDRSDTTDSDSEDADTKMSVLDLRANVKDSSVVGIKSISKELTDEWSSDVAWQIIQGHSDSSANNFCQLHGASALDVESDIIPTSQNIEKRDRYREQKTEGIQDIKEEVAEFKVIGEVRLIPESDVVKVKCQSLTIKEELLDQVNRELKLGKYSDECLETVQNEIENPIKDSTANADDVLGNPSSDIHRIRFSNFLNQNIHSGLEFGSQNVELVTSNNDTVNINEQLGEMLKLKQEVQIEKEADQGNVIHFPENYVSEGQHLSSPKNLAIDVKQSDVSEGAKLGSTQQIVMPDSKVNPSSANEPLHETNHPEENEMVHTEVKPISANEPLQETSHPEESEMVRTEVKPSSANEPLQETNHPVESEMRDSVVNPNSAKETLDELKVNETDDTQKQDIMHGVDGSVNEKDEIEKLPFCPACQKQFTYWYHAMVHLNFCKKNPKAKYHGESPLTEELQLIDIGTCAISRDQEELYADMLPMSLVTGLVKDYSNPGQMYPLIRLGK